MNVSLVDFEAGRQSLATFGLPVVDQLAAATEDCISCGCCRRTISDGQPRRVLRLCSREGRLLVRGDQRTTPAGWFRIASVAGDVSGVVPCRRVLIACVHCSSGWPLDASRQHSQRAIRSTNEFGDDHPHHLRGRRFERLRAWRSADEPTEPSVRTFGLEVGPDGLCIGDSWVPLSQVGSGTLTYEEAVAFVLQQVEALIQDQFAFCPGVDPGAGSPELWARAYLRTVVLPVPEPQVAPGGCSSGRGGPPRGRARSSTHQIDEAEHTVRACDLPAHQHRHRRLGRRRGHRPVATVGGPVPRRRPAPHLHPPGRLRHRRHPGVGGDVAGGRRVRHRHRAETTGVLAGFPVQEIEAVIVG